MLNTTRNNDTLKIFPSLLSIFYGIFFPNEKRFHKKEWINKFIIISKI